MKLDRHISLSVRHQKVCDQWKDFFVPSLNVFYPLHADLKFMKPKLSTWRDEAFLQFSKRDVTVSVMFYSYSTVDVTIHRSGTPRSSDVLKRFNCNYDKNDKLIVKELHVSLCRVFPEVLKELKRMESTQQGL